MQIYVRPLGGEEVQITIQGKDSIDTVMRAISQQGFETDGKSIVFEGKRLRGYRLAKSYGIKDGDTLHLLGRTRASAQSMRADEWSEYERMLHNVGWKGDTTMNHCPEFVELISVIQDAQERPSSIRNKGRFYELLTEEGYYADGKRRRYVHANMRPKQEQGENGSSWLIPVSLIVGAAAVALIAYGKYKR